MEAKGRLVSVSKDYMTSKFRLTFELDKDVAHELDGITGKDLRVKAVKWKEKRSLDANAYCWQLMGQIARVLHTTADEIYEAALRDLCIPDMIDDTPVLIEMDSDISVERLPGHWKLLGSLRNGRRKNKWMKLKGSSEYDTAEMSALIDLVVDQAKDLGIETATPDELERMRQLWQSKAS